MAESADPYKNMKKSPELDTEGLVGACPVTIHIDNAQIKGRAIIDLNEVNVYLDKSDLSRTFLSLVETRIITGLRITPILQEEAIRAGATGPVQGG